MVTMNAWLSSVEYLHRFADANDEQRANMTRFTALELDMSDCGWVRIGTASIDLHVDSQESIDGGAIKVIDLAIEKVRADFALRIKELQDARASLLSLPARVKA